MSPSSLADTGPKAGFPGLAALALLDGAILALACLLSSPLSALATLFAALLCLGRYGAMAGFSRGMAKGRWLFPLSLWIALFGLLALLLFLSGKKDVLLWPALVALSGPLVFMILSVAGALLGFPLILAPMRAQATPTLPEGSGGGEA